MKSRQSVESPLKVYIASKLENLKILCMCCDITILHKKDINKFKRSIAYTTIKVVIKCLSKNSTLWLDASSAKFCQIFNEEMTLTLLELFHVSRKEGTTRLILCSQCYPDDKIKTQGENNRERERDHHRERAQCHLLTSKSKSTLKGVYIIIKLVSIQG